MTGAENPLCDNAPTGQMRTAGHWWFCGQFSFLTIKVLFISATFLFYSAILPEKA